MKKIYIILFSILFSHTILNAQSDTLILEPSIHFGGVITSSAIKGDFAFLGQGNYLNVLDLSQDEIEQVAMLEFNKIPSDIHIQGDYAFIAAEGIIVVDISDPLTPVLIGESEAEIGEESKIFVLGDYAYLTSEEEGLIVMDISDKTSPEQVSTFSNGNEFSDVWVTDEYAFVCDKIGNELMIIDISDKENLEKVASTEILKPSSVNVTGNYAYITSRDWSELGMQIVDVTNPLEPEKKGFFETKIIDGFNTHYHRPSKVRVEGNKAYITCDAEFHFFIVDITNSTAPVKLGDMKLADKGNQINSFNIAFPYAYISISLFEEVGGYREINISDATNPVYERNYQSLQSVNWMQADTNFLYLVGPSALWIYDMTDQDNPELIKFYEEWGNMSRIFLKDNILFVLNFTDVIILDVNDPNNVVELGKYTPAAQALEIFATGDYIYLLIDGNPGTLEVVDISAPTNPVKVGETAIGGVGRDIFVDEEKQQAYLVYWEEDTKRGFQIFDVSSPSVPSMLSEMQTIGEPITLHSMGDKLFVGSNEDISQNVKWYIEAFDISDATSPVKVSDLSGEGEIWDIEVENETILAGIVGASVYGILSDAALNMWIEIIASVFRTVGISSAIRDDGSGYTVASGGEGVINKKMGGGGKGGHKHKIGNGGIRIITTSVPKRGELFCCLTTSVYPGKAGSMGCSASPAGCTPGACGGSVEVVANVGPEWKFHKWTGAASGSNLTTLATLGDPQLVPCQGGCANNATAKFTPWISLSGGNPSIDLCPVTEEEELQVATFFVKASLADAWTVNAITVNIGGNAEISPSITKARLEWEGGSQQIDYTIGSDALTFNIGNLKVSEGQSKSFKLYFTFKPIADLECPFEPKVLTLEISAGKMKASPSKYSPGKKLYKTGVTINVGCIRNENKNKAYETIQSAVDDATSGNTILVCPGVYEENVVVNKHLAIKSTNGAEVTIVKAKIPNRAVFEFNAEFVFIDGFTISNSSESSGILINNNYAGVENCYISFNKEGIWIESGDRSEIYNNEIVNNSDCGVRIEGEKSQSSILCGNYIGIDKTGVKQPNLHGICIQDGSKDNEIGCPGGYYRDNYISGNLKDGIRIEGEATKNNVIGANIIGLNLDANSKLGNLYGIHILDKANSNYIGAPDIACSYAGNIISGNVLAGILIEDNLSDKNNISCNFIGTNRIDALNIGNKNGIVIKNNAKENIIGDSCSKRGNIISGNIENGIIIDMADKNIISYNNIGTNNAGNKAVPNLHGVCIRGGAQFNIVGIDEKKDENEYRNSGNLISGNLKDGIRIEGEETKNNYISSNNIGLNFDANSKLGNRIGVHILDNASENSIDSDLDKNIISGNSMFGILIEGARTILNHVYDNIIGTNEKNTLNIGNRIGIEINNQAHRNVIYGNLISGNIEHGVKISGVGTNGNSMYGNKIGTDCIRWNPLGNGGYGVMINSGAENNIIGEINHFENTISGNMKGGIFISLSDNNIIDGNSIGVAIGGLMKIPNQGPGILVFESEGTIIGQSTFPESNLISGNYNDGIELLNCRHTHIYGNYIGTDDSGKEAIPNINGVKIVNGSENCICSNNISGNDLSGVLIESGNRNQIFGNTIGDNNIDNFIGISIKNSKENIIGGLKSDKRNKIFGNEKMGINVDFGYYNKIIGNFIANKENEPISKVGIEIFGPKNIISNNLISFFCDAIIDNGGEWKKGNESENIISNNYIINGSCTSSGIHLEYASPIITGNQITHDKGNAINCENRANPLIRKNNIFDNDGFGLNNEDPTVLINAQGNWWGYASGPDSNVNGNVDATNWATEPMDLVLALPVDTVYTPPGNSDSLGVYFCNWAQPMDIIDVTLSDSRGWLDDELIYTITFQDSLGADTLVYFTVPDVPEGTVDKVIIRLTSQIDTSWSDIDSFYIMAYTSYLSSIEIFPDTLSYLTIGDSLQFFAAGFDSLNNYFHTGFIWSTNGGVIDSVGMYYATEEGDFNIHVSNTDSMIWTETQVHVGAVNTKEIISGKNPIILYQNHPNPFEDETTIKFKLQNSGRITLNIYDIMGKKQSVLIDNWYKEGTHEVKFKSAAMNPGIYFYELRQGELSVVKKMMILKN